MRRDGWRVAVGVVLQLISFAHAADVESGGARDPDWSELRELREEVRQLRAEVDRLRQQQGPAGPSTRPATPDGGGAMAQQQAMGEVLRDADSHSRFMTDSGVTGGYEPGHGFFLRSDDGNFVLSPFALFQARGIVNDRQDAKPGKSDDTQTGLEIRRVQFGVDGNFLSPDLTYRIFWQSSELTSGNLQLLMAWVQYRFHNTPWVIGGGQFKDPLDHEQLSSDATQLATDRTFVDDELAGGEAFSRGVTLRYDDHGPFRAEAALTSGFNVPNTSFQQFPTNPADYGVAARGEYKFFGNWKDYEQFSSQQNHADLLVVGAGTDYTEAGHTAAFRHVIDAQFNPGPLGFYAAYLGRYTRGNTAGRGGDTYDPSVRAQVAWLFAPRWEVFGRYDYVHFDGREFAAGTRSTVQEITIGGTYYFAGQNAKFTVDLSYLPDGTPVADQGNDVLANAGHGELAGRAQFQLLL